MLKLSVITVVYNNLTDIEDTILNVLELKENNESIEYIIIDGGSTDGTCDIIEKYCDKISCFISESDKGIYDAMNKGVDLAQGEWLIFMNSGDLFYNNDFFRKTFLGNKNISDYDIIYGNTLAKNEGEILFIPYKIIKPYFFFLNTICHQSVFFSRRVFNRVGYYNLDYKIISDRDLLYRISNSKGKFFHIEDIISIWDEEGFSKENFSLFLEEDRIFTRKNFNFFERSFLRFERKLKSGLNKIKLMKSIKSDY
ncbi:glycosyltransferase family 2 protein [Flavobacterium marginilacus]|uniref:glycosyltransferase family 2 protein n=1 Tax=Flavobacterium marginilacus TaxID=3003256 RepID=UPI00248DCF80|nr:glycosyltransferase family 2 protein [Flavobacterium marginilacus]